MNVRWCGPAERELIAAHEWYELRRAGLGDDLLLCIEASLDGIEAFPRRGVVVHGEVRRVLIRRFPYGIYYRVSEAEIEIIGFRHFRQRLPQP